MDLLVCQSENGFSLDEFVKKLLEACEKKVFPELLRTILMLTQEVLIYRILNEKKNAMECCTERHLTLNGSFESAELRSVCPPMAEVGVDLTASIIHA